MPRRHLASALVLRANHPNEIDAEVAAVYARLRATGVTLLNQSVSGAAHFAVPDRRARRLVGELAARLPGYLMPRLVREIHGAPAKVSLAPRLPVPRARSYGTGTRRC